jgi:UDP-N-acetylglucosamine/UDP-N-acetylgalactosamine diphosphorylase
MREAASLDVETLRRRAATYGQGHLFTFFDQLPPQQQRELLNDIMQIDFATVAQQASPAVSAAAPVMVDRLAPAEAWPHAPPPGQEDLYRAARQRGAQILRRGEVAAMTVAGGQGTRLGFEGPKGAFPISPVKRKPLFQLFAETIRWAQRHYDVRSPWYIMTSSATDAATRTFFAEHGAFGLSRDDIIFFQQGVMPALDRDGKILLAERHRVALSPDGHGGSLTALARSGALADMRARGVEALSYFQVDNPLVQPFDPLFLGMHAEMRAQVASLTISKADDLERVGNFARYDGRLWVIEYSDLPEELARARTPDGRRKFDLANIAIHVFARDFLDGLTSDGGSLSLPWHRAAKKVPYVDLTTGQKVEPDQPNAVKLERFVFDALPLAERTLLLQAERGEVFSPVKNATAVDSVETARRDMVRRAARWLQTCSVSVPFTPDGEPDCLIEISPLLAPDLESLQGAPLGIRELERRQAYYFE